MNFLGLAVSFAVLRFKRNFQVREGKRVFSLRPTVSFLDLIRDILSL